MSIPVFRPFIKRKDMDAVLTCLLSDQLGSGSETKLLVEELAGLYGMAGGVAVREYPRAMELALRSLGLPSGSRIGLGALSSHLWDQAIRDLGYWPVLADCEEANPCPSSSHLMALHAAEPLAALVLDNELGLSGNLAAYREMGLPIVADVTQLLGQTIAAGREELPPADLGDCLLMGLEAASPVTAGGGVAVLVGSRNAQGKQIQANLLKLADALAPEVRLSDMNAALGRTQTRELVGFMERRQNIQEVLRRAALRGRHKLLHNGLNAETMAYGFPLVIQSSVAEVQVYARKKNVETVHAFGHSILTSLSELEGFEPRTYPHALGLSLRCLLFPLYPGLSQKELDTVEKVVATLP